MKTSNNEPKTIAELIKIVLQEHALKG